MKGFIAYIGRALRNPGVSRGVDQTGFVYRHAWETGYQDLVFRTHGDAVKFSDQNGVRYEGPEEKNNS